jgi:hypothetical protein
LIYFVEAVVLYSGASPRSAGRLPWRQLPYSAVGEAKLRLKADGGPRLTGTAGSDARSSAFMEGFMIKRDGLLPEWAETGRHPGVEIRSAPGAAQSPARKATPNFLTASDCVMITLKKDRNHGTKQSNQHRT